jgi:hypothetical protein
MSTAAAIVARVAVVRRCAGVSFRVITSFVGITAIGSTMKRTDVNVISAYWRNSLKKTRAGLGSSGCLGNGGI